MVGFSKQAHWKWLKRQQYLLDKWLLLEPLLVEYRSLHPAMSLKKLYWIIQPDFIGKNLFIEFAMANGFEATSYKKVPKTSILSPKSSFPNLLVDQKISDINQVWVSDITYFKVLRKWYYLTFIMDLYSRRIIGYHASDNLFAQANQQALNMALQTRANQNFEHQLIHHSDRGAQYKSLIYVNALQNAKINISMGRIVYDNIQVERLHQTIKGEYLIHRNIRSENELIFHLHKDVKLYNEQRPHLKLGHRSPCQFESYLSNVPLNQRTFLSVFALKTAMPSKGNSSKFCNPAQLRLPFL